MENQPIIRYLDFGDIDIGGLLLLSGEDERAMKKKVLWRLGIRITEDQTPLHAWLLAMCRENNLPEVLPAPNLSSLILTDRAAVKFMFFLA